MFHAFTMHTQFPVEAPSICTFLVYISTLLVVWPRMVHSNQKNMNYRNGGVSPAIPKPTRQFEDYKEATNACHHV
jgi:hypothetical protein